MGAMGNAVLRPSLSSRIASAIPPVSIPVLDVGDRRTGKVAKAFASEKDREQSFVSCVAAS